MKRLTMPLLIAALLATALAAAPTAAPSTAPTPAASALPSATPSPDPAIVKRAETIFAQMQRGKVDRSQLDAKMDAVMTAATLQALHDKLGPLGTPVTFEQQRIIVSNGFTGYVYLLAFGNTKTLDFVMVLDGANKIGGLLVK